MATTVKLGNVDQGAMPADKKKFLAPYHAGMSAELQNMLQFRNDAGWNPFVQVPGTSVRELQQFLKDAGFMPKALVDGVFGYGTQAAVRLFQEYIRTIEGDASIGTPDGIVGPNTWSKINAWKTKYTGKPEFVCAWGRATAQQPSAEFQRWIDLLSQAKAHFSSLKASHPIVKLVEAYPKACDTKKVDQWDTSPNTIHLIGIRRAQEVGSDRRGNDDLFVLLIKGMVFKFWGSTDPNRQMATRDDIPFLVEGQHEYQFSWHKASDAEKIYQALRPASIGVMVFRDMDKDRALTQADIDKGLDPSPNTTVNIHWSGIGSANYSAGCQVIAGNRYMREDGTAVDCQSFAAVKQSDLGSGKTRGAYNVFADLILSYAPEGVRTLRYMLGRDETFKNFEGWDNSFVAADVEQMRRGLV